MTDKDMCKFLYDYDVYDAYQYISNARKTAGIAFYCKEMIAALFSKMENENKEWKTDLFGQLLSAQSELKSMAIKFNNMPSYNLTICGIETSIPFLMDKLIKDFFQYIRNAFDSMSQAINASFLASRSKNIEKVDFSMMKSVFNQQMYSQAFPNLTVWFNTIESSNEFAYIQSFNNRTKHICDVYLNLSMSIIGGENTASLKSFIKNNKQQSQQTVLEYLDSIYDFVSKAYSELIIEIKSEIPKKQFVGTRISNPKVYQRKFKEDDNNNFSIFYIDEIDNISKMPNEIEILLFSDIDGIITAKNCPAKTVYVRDSKDKNKYIGKYVTDEIDGEDTLVKYKKYKKVIWNEGEIPLLLQAMINPENKGVFYNKNPFVDIETISDDNEFLTRIQLPF